MRKQNVVAAAVGLAVLSALESARANVISITDVPPVSVLDSSGSGFVTATFGSDYLVYQQINSTQLQVNSSSSVVSVLSGTKSQSAPGGNVRLYNTSDGTPLPAFQTAPHVVLSGTMNGHSVKVSSLDGNDWFTTPTGYNTSFGANNLANTWFNSFLGNYHFATILAAAGYGSQIPVQEADLYNEFLTYTGQGGGGFQHLSGPSVSYVQEDLSTDILTVGLADTDGYLEPLIQAYVAANAPALLPFVPSDVYASKVVGVAFDGGAPTYNWSFSQQSSGLVTTDSTASDNIEFQATFTAPVPEPASGAFLISIGSMALLRRRRVSNAAESSPVNDGLPHLSNSDSSE